MKMSFRWYGPDDPVTLQNIRQIPNMQAIVTAVYDVPVGEVWSRKSIAALKKQTEDNGLQFDMYPEFWTHKKLN
ncbi:mannonate dehydratase [Hominenteromicrobium mulieris]|uniref:mannonate dehydratase n=1 Tax=Hominenteromicrobium mulieris TaxID=2885357 RepID=UPI00376F976B